MKKFKTILSTVLALAMVFTLSSSVFAVEKNTAYIGFMAGDWSPAYWGTGHADSTPEIIGTDALVDGPGQYTVGLDFTGTEAGVSNGTQFMALMIEGFEETNPGWLVQIDSFKINGEDASLGNYYTSCDADGKFQTRVNLYQQWEANHTNPDNFPRVLTGTIEEAAAIVVNVDEFVDVKTITIDFTLIDPNAVEEVAEVEEVAVTEEAPATSTPKTGVVGLELVYGLGAVATALVALKKRNK